MVRHGIDCLGECFDDGKCVSRAQQSLADVASRPSGFADWHIEKLAENLRIWITMILG